MKTAFPGVTGFSSRNLRDVKFLVSTYSDEAMWRQLVAKFDDGSSAGSGGALRQNLVILNKIKASASERSREAGKNHNYLAALPEALTAQTEYTLKGSYDFGFLGIENIALERDLEECLLDRLRDFILELDYGFCFVGRQCRLTLGEKDYFIDILFYHRFLKCLLAIELKNCLQIGLQERRNA